MNKIPGQPDHSTALLPATRLLVVPRTILGPTRPTRAEWPTVADPQAVTTSHLQPGRIATIRTRFGLHKRQIRYVARSYQPGRNRGRHYVVAMDRHGICHSHWIDRITRIEPLQALPPGPTKPTRRSTQ